MKKANILRQSKDLIDFLDCYANSVKITAGLTELRNFLGVEYQENGIVWINGFLDFLGQIIPIAVPIPNVAEQEAIISSVC